MTVIGMYMWCIISFTDNLTNSELKTLLIIEKCVRCFVILMAEEGNLEINSFLRKRRSMPGSKLFFFFNLLVNYFNYSLKCNFILTEYLRTFFCSFSLVLLLQ